MVADESKYIPRPWLDVVSELTILRSRPYLIEVDESGLVVETLRSMGFRVVEVHWPPSALDAEQSLLIELTRRLGFSELGAGSWAAFNDRLWDLQMYDKGEPPIALMIHGLDRLLMRDVQSFVGSIHRLLSMTESVELDDQRNDLQIEYFFVGGWREVAEGRAIA